MEMIGDVKKGLVDLHHEHKWEARKNLGKYSSKGEDERRKGEETGSGRERKREER